MILSPVLSIYRPMLLWRSIRVVTGILLTLRALGSVAGSIHGGGSCREGSDAGGRPGEMRSSQMMPGMRWNPESGCGRGPRRWNAARRVAVRCDGPGEARRRVVSQSRREGSIHPAMARRPRARRGRGAGSSERLGKGDQQPSINDETLISITKRERALERNAETRAKE